jgi:hypothetical protein
MEECRLRDPLQAENPASQDSVSSLSGNKSCSAGFYEEEDTSWT